MVSEIAVSSEVRISQSHFVSLKYDCATAVINQFLFLNE